MKPFEDPAASNPRNKPKRSFYDRWGHWILGVTLLFVPFAFFGAAKAVQSNMNKVEDWLPKTFDETHELAWFRKNFPTDQFVLLSWEGCKLGDDPSLPDAKPDDPRIEAVAKFLSQGLDTATKESTEDQSKPEVGSESLDVTDSRLFVKSVVSGRQMIEQLTAAPSSVPYDEAVKRLTGSLIGPDGRQTCLVVSLTPDASKKLKLVLGRGQMRIFRPNVPPGVIRRAIASAGIPEEDFRMGGPPVDNVAIDEEGERTLVRLAGASALLGIGLAWWSLRSIVLTMVVFFCGIVSAALALAIIYVTGETVDAIVLSMPALVYVLSISGAVHFINYYRDAVIEHGLDGAIERAVVHAFKPAILCSTTTAIGLGSLYASDLVPIRKFGIYAAAGVIVLVGVQFLFLPTILHMIGFGRKWVGLTKDPSEDDSRELSEPTTTAEKFWTMFGTSVVKNYAAVGFACVAITGFISYGLVFTRTSIDLLELFDSRARILQDYRWLETNIGRLVPLEIVIRFNRDSQATGVRNADSNAEDLYRLTFLERMETTALIQDLIESQFGAKGTNIVGKSLSAANFSPSLPSVSGDTGSFIQRMAYNTRLTSSRDAFIDSGFLRIDEKDGSELWRISLRVAAFEGVDYGNFVHEIRDRVEPIMIAHQQRVHVLKQLSAWSPEQKYSGSKVYLWDRPYKANKTDPDDERQKKHAATVSALESLLVKARIKVIRGEADPASVPVISLQQLNQLDGVVLSGNFSESDSRTIQWAVNKVVDLDADSSLVNAPKASSILASENETWLSAVYTGVVPIVYKAQRALLQSLVESTLWSFLTITPLMMIVSRSIRAGAVAMLPNIVPVVVIFGAMGWLNIAIDIGSMMSASIALGVAVDDTIHFLSWFRSDLDKLQDRNKAIVSAYRRCATPTLQAALISGIGLSVFAFSTFTPTQRFGWLMLTILIAGVISELVLLPSILASPLGSVFEPHSGRRSINRWWLIARYQWRRVMRADEPQPTATRNRAA